MKLTMAITLRASCAFCQLYGIEAVHSWDTRVSFDFEPNCAAGGVWRVRGNRWQETLQMRSAASWLGRVCDTKPPTRNTQMTMKDSASTGVRSPHG